MLTKSEKARLQALIGRAKREQRWHALRRVGLYEQGLLEPEVETIPFAEDYLVTKVGDVEVRSLAAMALDMCELFPPIIVSGWNETEEHFKRVDVMYDHLAEELRGLLSTATPEWMHHVGMKSNNGITVNYDKRDGEPE